MINRTEEMRDLDPDTREELIALGELEGKVHDLRLVLAEKLKFRMGFARNVSIDPDIA